MITIHGKICNKKKIKELRVVYSFIKRLTFKKYMLSIQSTLFEISIIKIKCVRKILLVSNVEVKSGNLNTNQIHNEEK